jgi:hypothetical protein
LFERFNSQVIKPTFIALYFNPYIDYVQIECAKNIKTIYVDSEVDLLFEMRSMVNIKNKKGSI